MLLLHGFPEIETQLAGRLAGVAAAGDRASRATSAVIRRARDLIPRIFELRLRRAGQRRHRDVAAAGHEGRRFHQVGHDWGG